jgi:cytochrome d ubiquinol oxidase subunit I
VPSPLIAATLALYVTVYVALVVAYVSVVKYMAEKPVDMSAPALPAGPRITPTAGVAP